MHASAFFFLLSIFKKKKALGSASIDASSQSTGNYEVIMNMKQYPETYQTHPNVPSMGNTT